MALGGISSQQSISLGNKYIVNSELRSFYQYWFHCELALIKAIVCIAAGNQLFARAAAISSAKHLGAAGLPRDFGALGPL